MNGRGVLKLQLSTRSRLTWPGHKYLHAEQASAPRHVNLARLEEIIAEDHGKRGIAPLVIRGELARAAYHLSHDISPGAPRACQHVAILTGYPCYPGSPPTETDGPLGAIATARALVALGKTATILTDVVNEGPVRAALDASNLVYPQSVSQNNDGETSEIGLRAFHGDSGKCGKGPRTASLAKYQKIADEMSIDTVVAIERMGRAADGGYYTMRGRDMALSVDLAELDYLASVRSPQGSAVHVIAVGDGGNEMGMGKVQRAVEEHIPKGAIIGSTVGCTDLIVCGVSNWGGWALCLGMLQGRFAEEALGFDPQGVRPGINASDLLSIDGERQVLEGLVAAGARDGVTFEAAESVDGMHWPFHACMLSRMLMLL